MLKQVYGSIKKAIICIFLRPTSGYRFFLKMKYGVDKPSGYPEITWENGVLKTQKEWLETAEEVKIDNGKFRWEINVESHETPNLGKKRKINVKLNLSRIFVWDGETYCTDNFIRLEINLPNAQNKFLYGHLSFITLT